MGNAQHRRRRHGVKDWSSSTPHVVDNSATLGVVARGRKQEAHKAEAPDVLHSTTGARAQDGGGADSSAYAAFQWQRTQALPEAAGPSAAGRISKHLAGMHPSPHSNAAALGYGRRFGAKGSGAGGPYTPSAQQLVPIGILPRSFPYGSLAMGLPDMDVGVVSLVREHAASVGPQAAASASMRRAALRSIRPAGLLLTGLDGPVLLPLEFAALLTHSTLPPHKLETLDGEGIESLYAAMSHAHRLAGEAGRGGSYGSDTGGSTGDSNVERGISGGTAAGVQGGQALLAMAAAGGGGGHTGGGPWPGHANLLNGHGPTVNWQLSASAGTTGTAGSGASLESSSALVPVFLFRSSGKLALTHAPASDVFGKHGFSPAGFTSGGRSISDSSALTSAAAAAAGGAQGGQPFSAAGGDPPITMRPVGTAASSAGGGVAAANLSLANRADDKVQVKALGVASPGGSRMDGVGAGGLLGKAESSPIPPGTPPRGPQPGQPGASMAEIGAGATKKKRGWFARRFGGGGKGRSRRRVKTASAAEAGELVTTNTGSETGQSPRRPASAEPYGAGGLSSKGGGPKGPSAGNHGTGALAHLGVSEHLSTLPDLATLPLDTELTQLIGESRVDWELGEGQAEGLVQSYMTLLSGLRQGMTMLSSAAALHSVELPCDDDALFAGPMSLLQRIVRSLFLPTGVPRHIDDQSLVVAPGNRPRRKYRTGNPSDGYGGKYHADEQGDLSAYDVEEYVTSAGLESAALSVPRRQVSDWDASPDHSAFYTFLLCLQYTSTVGTANEYGEEPPTMTFYRAIRPNLRKRISDFLIPRASLSQPALCTSCGGLWSYFVGPWHCPGSHECISAAGDVQQAARQSLGASLGHPNTIKVASGEGAAMPARIVGENPAVVQVYRPSLPVPALTAHRSCHPRIGRHLAGATRVGPVGRQLCSSLRLRGVHPQRCPALCPRCLVSDTFGGQRTKYQCASSLQATTASERLRC